MKEGQNKVRRRRFLYGLAAVTGSAMSGCVSGRAKTESDNEATVEVYNRRDDEISVLMAFSSVNETSSCSRIATTPNEEPLSVGAGETRTLATLPKFGTYQALVRVDDQEMGKCIEYDGDRSSFTFVVDDNIMFTNS